MDDPNTPPSDYVTSSPISFDAFHLLNTPPNPFSDPIPPSPYKEDASPPPSNGMTFTYNIPLGMPAPLADQIRLLVQPASYQVVNYNIFPSPEIEFSQCFDYPITVEAFLIYENTEVAEGFTSGMVQILKPKENKVVFPTLHLNRMTPIKNSISQTSTLSNHLVCYVKFRIADFNIVSNAFKLVSACNRIPPDVHVRPRWVCVFFWTKSLMLI